MNGDLLPRVQIDTETPCSNKKPVRAAKPLTGSIQSFNGFLYASMIAKASSL
jgi:hypothetical protein